MNPERYVLAARLVSYLGERYRALEILSEGLDAFPGDLRLLHQRGTMRLITRAIPEARADLEAAVAHEGWDAPDTYREQVVGDVLALVLDRQDAEPTHAAHGSVRAGAWLHLGLTHYLLGDLDAAAQAFARSRELAHEPYQELAAVDWGYLSLYRAGRPEEAQSLVDDLVWDDYRLGGAASTTGRSLERCYVQRLQLYRGEARPEELLRATSTEGIDVATLGYGVGVWYLCHGYDAAAARTFERILEVGDPTTMGYLAAESERARPTEPSPGPA
ncbi:hypothetical protein [Ornithinimicrobium sufpigmenti]|uniref:hypothetical protein n=1 Tax=Ornithinimicrobium sufpigmenti TaxID=2508882 RepID=UPI0010358757|nr:MULTISPECIES: hypothetical protein [unclassified Ornithinimicrobium]